ncbi:MAG: Bax inhibitor-1/YccA family protein [bacterium]
MELRSGNPAFSDKTFDTFEDKVFFNKATLTERMTVEGTATKTGILLLMAVITAAFPWNLTLNPATMGLGWALAIGGLFGALIVSLITCFKPTAAPVTAPIYALLEGLALGAISARYNDRYEGIVAQAIGLTFGVMAIMLIAYMGRLVRATPKFTIGVIAATGSVALLYLVSMVMNLFGFHMPFLHDSGPIGIGISLVIVAIAALNFVLDFDLIESGARRGAPKFMEWYAAFGLMVTLVWLYMEILRLLSKLSRR